MNTLNLIRRPQRSIHDLLTTIPQGTIYHLLAAWGCNPVLKDDKIIAKCPNHIYHAGHHSSHDDKFTAWDNGYTNCFTGSHKDNILHIASEVWHCDIEEAYKRITNGVYTQPDFGHVVTVNKTISNIDRIRMLNRNIEWVQSIEPKPYSDECIAYFANDGITVDTLEFFQVIDIGASVQDNWKCDGRALIPFFKSVDEVCGFITVSYKSKEWQCKNMADWAVKQDPAKTWDEWYKTATEKYRKVVYCPGFTSRDHLFGRYEAMSNFTSWDELMIVEGERDCMKMLQEGINCVSIHGTNIKSEQLTMIQSMNPHHIYIGLDMDEAGREGSRKAVKQLADIAEDVRILEFPEGKDPKKFNGEQIRQIIGGDSM